jgi:hypothetical protein
LFPPAPGGGHLAAKWLSPGSVNGLNGNYPVFFNYAIFHWRMARVLFPINGIRVFMPRGLGLVSGLLLELIPLVYQGLGITASN